MALRDSEFTALAVDSGRSQQGKGDILAAATVLGTDVDFPVAAEENVGATREFSRGLSLVEIHPGLHKHAIPDKALGSLLHWARVAPEPKVVLEASGCPTFSLLKDLGPQPGAEGSGPAFPLFLGDAQYRFMKDAALLQGLGEVRETSPGHLHCFNDAVLVGGFVFLLSHLEDSL